MGWRAISKEFEETSEATHGRPVEAGENGKLLIIAQEDFGRKVAVDLVNGIVAIDYDHLGVADNAIVLDNPKFSFLICDETNIVGELADVQRRSVPMRDEQGRKILRDGKFLETRMDVVIPLVWRPIWFTRYTNGIPTKVIGAQTTLPQVHGGKNVKKMVSIFENGEIGID